MIIKKLNRDWLVALAVLVFLPMQGCISEVYDYWAGLADDGGVATSGAGDVDVDGDMDGDSDSDSDADSDSDSDTDSDGDADSDTESGSESEGCEDTGEGTDTSDSESVVDTETGSNNNTDGGMDAGADIDAGADGGISKDPYADGTCPSEMVFVSAALIDGLAESYCMDIYEASRTDANETLQGDNTDLAWSVAGVIPWHTNPISLATLGVYAAACEAADKKLCKSNEWFSACYGPDSSNYVFGEPFDASKCNCIDACCPEYCNDNSITPEDCNTGNNCGGAYGCAYGVLPTGLYTECTNALGTRDLNGNVWETVPSETDPRGYEVRGGAYNCWSPYSRLKCDYNAGWNGLFAGFRCCKTPTLKK